ncbi:MAG TPA: gluconokinase [Trueperaceae bacterium]
MKTSQEAHSEPNHEAARAIVVMGVSGSGKSTVGRLLARRLEWEFADADVFHSETNVEKMRRGVPLDDADRRPWLQTLAELLADRLSRGRSIVLACSALKGEYRDLLTGGSDRVSFVYLKGSRELILDRLRSRVGHYMKPDMLDSQFSALEEPTDAMILDVSRPPAELAEEVERRIRSGRALTGPG